MDAITLCWNGGSEMVIIQRQLNKHGTQYTSMVLSKTSMVLSKTSMVLSTQARYSVNKHGNQ
jgi:hypothetical protein